MPSSHRRQVLAVLASSLGAVVGHGRHSAVDLHGRAHPYREGVADETTPGRSRNMAAIRRRDTKPERLLRSALHARGHRYRVDHRLDLPDGRVRPDIVFTRRRVAVFVDGCYWHGCPDHGRRPNIKNAAYWGSKLQGNVDRDRRADSALEAAGWTVVRVWEHEPVDEAAARVEEALTASA